MNQIDEKNWKFSAMREDRIINGFSMMIEGTFIKYKENTKSSENNPNHNYISNYPQSNLT